MILFRTTRGPVVRVKNFYYAVARDWDELVNDDNLHDYLHSICATTTPDEALAGDTHTPMAPIGNQELWAAGVTYHRSRTARMEESQQTGGESFYDRVYSAERPELFLKTTPQRVVGTDTSLHLRSDSRWMVPEPELVLVVTRRAGIVGYTIGNDLSCRDIEGENPLYLPQAKTFDRCAALGPGVLIAATPPPPETTIRLTISRDDRIVFSDETTLAQMKRTLQELVHYLFLDNSHPNGCLLMTGTGIVPPDDFSLQTGDTVEIGIDGIGTLTNTVN